MLHGLHPLSASRAHINVAGVFCMFGGRIYKGAPLNLQCHKHPDTCMHLQMFGLDNAGKDYHMDCL